MTYIYIRHTFLYDTYVTYTYVYIYMTYIHMYIYREEDAAAECFFQFEDIRFDYFIFSYAKGVIIHRILYAKGIILGSTTHTYMIYIHIHMYRYIYIYIYTLTYICGPCPCLRQATYIYTL